MINLVEAFGTKYFTVDYDSKLREFLEENKKNVIDIADARFVPTTMDIIRDQTIRGVDIVDTFNQVRNERLQQIVAQRVTFGMEEIELPLLNDFTLIIDYLKALDPEALYKPIPNQSDAYNISLILLIQYHRPSIKINIDNVFAPMFIFLNDCFSEEIYNKLIQTTDEFMFINTREHFIAKVTENDLFTPFLVGDKKMTWNTVRSTYTVIPTYFGSEKIKQDPERKPLFSRVVGKSQKYLQAEIAKMNRQKLTDVLRGGN